MRVIMMSKIASVFIAACSLASLTACRESVPIASVETRLKNMLVRNAEEDIKPFSYIRVGRGFVFASDERAGADGRTEVRQITLCAPEMSSCRSVLTTLWKKYSCGYEFGPYFDVFKGGMSIGLHWDCDTHEYDRVEVSASGDKNAEMLAIVWKEQSEIATRDMQACNEKYGQTEDVKKQFVCVFR